MIFVRSGLSIAGQLWRLLCQYHEHSFKGGRFITELYPFLYQTLSEKANPVTTICKYMPIIISRKQLGFLSSDGNKVILYPVSSNIQAVIGRLIYNAISEFLMPLDFSSIWRSFMCDITWLLIQFACCK